MKKKICILLLAMLMGLFLFGCTNAEAETESDTEIPGNSMEYDEMGCC